MDLPVSPLAPAKTPTLPTIPGVGIATVCSGTKYQNRDDVLIMRFPAGTVMAGVYTQNKCPGAPIDWNRPLTPGLIDTLVVNAGNANVFTGAVGQASVQAMATAAPGDRVTVSSTGVIGEPLDDAAMVQAIQSATNEKTWSDAANAIRTTDTFAKLATAMFTTQAGEQVVLNGIAKGSGMVAPDMATMLGYIVSNVALEPHQAQTALAGACRTSFNAITVDSDQSTSDTLQLFATGDVPLSAEDLATFTQYLTDICQNLAEQIVRDGEGASKLIRVHVCEAETDEAAANIALAIANSPLVKTAMAGNDANWGRVVMAVGKAGEHANRDKLWIEFGQVRVAENGRRHPDYSEVAATDAVSQTDVDLRVGVGIGEGKSSVLTCDLTHGYISINGDYRS